MAEYLDLDDTTTATVAPPREAHEFQPGTLIVGLLVLAGAVLYLVNDGGVLDVDGQVAGAVLLLIVGATLVIKTAIRLVGRGGSD